MENATKVKIYHQYLTTKMTVNTLKVTKEFKNFAKKHEKHEKNIKIFKGLPLKISLKVLKILRNLI